MDRLRAAIILIRMVAAVAAGVALGLWLRLIYLVLFEKD